MPNRVLALCAILLLSMAGLAAAGVDINNLWETLEANTQPVNGSGFDQFLVELTAEHKVQVQNFLAYRAGKQANPFGEDSFLSAKAGLHGEMWVSDLDASLVISIGFKTYQNSYPVIVAMLDEHTQKARYLDSDNLYQKLKSMESSESEPSEDDLLAQFISSPNPRVIMLPNIAIMYFLPMQMRYVEKSRSTEAQTSISTIRKVYDVYMQTNGSTAGLTIEQAIKEARLGENTRRHWKFSVTGNPPRMFIAVSTADFPGGAGLQVWYDVMEAKFHGYGIDTWKLPK